MLLRRSFAGPAGMLLVLAALSGCSGEHQPLARVGPRTVTEGDFLAVAGGARQTYPGEPDSAKARLLDDLVKRELVICAAEEMGKFRDTLVVGFRKAKEEELLTQALGRSLMPAAPEVSEGELEQLYAWRDTLVHVQAMYFFTQSTATLARAELERGGEFAEVASRYNPTGSLPPDGDLGEQQVGNLVQPIDEIVRTAPLNLVIGPVQATGQGWFLLKVLGRRHHTQPPFESQKSQLADMLRQRKQRATAVANYLKLRAAYALEILPGGGQAVFAYTNPPGPAPPTLSAEELARPIMRWQEPGGARLYTLGDAVIDLNVGGREKPNGMVLPAIEEWLLNEGTRRIQVVEARRRRIPDDPNFQRMVDETVNNYVLDAIYADEVISKSATRPGDAELAYQRHRAQLEKLESATLRVVDFPDSVTAAKFAEHGAHAGSLDGALAMLPNAPRAQTLEITFPATSPDWAALEPTLAAMPPGTSLGPFATGHGYRAFQVISKKTSIPSFEALDANTRGQMEQEAVEVARERRLNEYLAELRTKFKTETYPERLKRVAWPS